MAIRYCGAAALAVGLVLAGCGGDGQDAPGATSEDVDAQVRAKWGKPLAELPAAELVAISPHNENIQDEFTWAFTNYYALEYGRRVRIEWRNVGGGGSAIARFVRNMYSRGESSGIDILWGGGEFHFQKLAREGLLVPMRLSDDVLENIPAKLGGLEMYDEERRWCGSAVSGFGFIYNIGMLQRSGIEPPKQWQDLADNRFADLLALADPTQSGSAAATYEMIVQSQADWPGGWARLLSILANARRFTDSAGDAANAPALGEALVAACIDFYGAIRVAEAPEELVYVSPAGQTAFSPDPIAILKNPPHGELAQRFVDFVLSRRGQALWALRVGQRHGPQRSALGRQPIRRDVYQAYAGRMSPWIVDPYRAVGALKIDPVMRNVRFGVLKSLVRAAAIDNRDGLRAARDRLIASGYDEVRLAEFVRLPENVSSREKIAEVAKRLKDPTDAERIVTEWSEFFREKYLRVAE